MSTRVCKSCGQDLPLSEYYRKKQKNGYSIMKKCKECHLSTLRKKCKEGPDYIKFDQSDDAYWLTREM